MSKTLNNITPITFAAYGAVFRNGISAAAQQLGYTLIKTREISHSRFTRLFFHTSEKTALEIADGTCILYVGLNQDELVPFLLDVTVIINPGVYYTFVPLINTAVILIASAADTSCITVSAQDRPQNIIPIIEPKEIYTFFYHEKECGFSFKGEKHELWELTYVDRGYLYNVVDGIEYRVPQGGLMLFAPNQFHSQYSDKNISVCYVTVTFRMNQVDEELFLGTVFRADGEIKALVKKMLSESDSDRIFADDLMLCYLKEIIIALARSKRLEKVAQSAFAPIKQNIESDIVSAAELYVRRNISKRFNVSDVAKSIPVSESYLSVLFKKNTGTTLSSYITSRRLEVAKAYIREGRFTFTQISDMVGYNNVYYFSSSFKKYFGITPTEYANSINQ